MKPNSPPPQYDVGTVGHWWPRHGAGQERFRKRQKSVLRRYANGEMPHKLRRSLVRLHRMSKDFDGNGSTKYLLQKLGLGSCLDAYSTHIDEPDDLPSQQETGDIRMELREEYAERRAQRLEQRREDADAEMNDAHDRVEALEDELRKAYRDIRIV